MSGVKYKTFKSPEDGKENEVKTKGYTIDEALNKIGFGRAHLKVGIIGGIAWVADGAEIMVLSILGPVLICQWGISKFQEAFITTIVFIGLSFGSLTFGYIADKYGRKKSLMVSTVWLLFYAIITVFAPNLVWILILRFMVGFGIGGCPQVITMCSELLPTKSRGKLLMSTLLFWTAGSLMQVVFAILLMPLGWRYWLISSALPVLVFVIFMKFLPDNPRFMLSMGKTTEATAVLKEMAEANKTSLPEGELLPLEVLPRARIQDLLVPKFRRTSALLLFLWIASAFSYYGLVLFSTDLINHGGTCIGKHTSFLEKSSCGSAPCHPLTTKSYLDILVTSFAELPGLLVGMILIDLIGRKKTLIILFFLYTVGTALLNICLSRIPMMILLFMARATVTTAFQELYVYTSEIYPTQCRALSLGIGSMLSRFGAIITPYVAEVLLSRSLSAGLAVYSVVGVLSTIASCLLVIETKGKEMNESKI